MDPRPSCRNTIWGGPAPHVAVAICASPTATSCLVGSPTTLFYATSIAGHQKSVERSLAASLVDGESGRALLTTILGEFVRPHDQGAWTQSLVAVLDQFGVSDKAARQTIARLRDQGWLTSNRRGRQTRWELTDLSTELLTEGADRIYQFGQVARPWDSEWLVVLASVPDVDRNLRYRLSVGLRWAGLGSLGQGIWISPWTDSEAPAAQLTRELGISATSFRAQLGELGSGPELADQAWDLVALRDAYRQFLIDTEPLVGARAQDSYPASPAAALTALVHRWRRFPSLDPDLPVSLLPSDWPGPEAARRFATLRRALVDPARREWQAMEAGFTPTAEATS